MNFRPFRWYGSKLRMVDKIVDLLPDHKLYVEPFAGSASVLLNHPKSDTEILNDMDEEIVHFFKTLADKNKGEHLIQKLCQLEYSRECFDIARKFKILNYKGLSDIEKAIQIYVLISQSFNSNRQGYSEKAYRDTEAYRESIAFHLPFIQERLQGVTILNGDGIELIKSFVDNENAFIFADPPYRKDVRGKGADKVYGVEMADIDIHIKLLKTIQNAKAKIMLCGYRSKEGIDLYDRHLIPYGWKCYKLCDIAKSCQVSKNKKDLAQEYIWCNYILPNTAEIAIEIREYNSIK